MADERKHKHGSEHSHGHDHDHEHGHEHKMRFHDPTHAAEFDRVRRCLASRASLTQKLTEMLSLKGAELVLDVATRYEEGKAADLLEQAENVYAREPYDRLE